NTKTPRSRLLRQFLSSYVFFLISSRLSHECTRDNCIREWAILLKWQSNWVNVNRSHVVAPHTRMVRASKVPSRYGIPLDMRTSHRPLTDNCLFLRGVGEV